MRFAVLFLASGALFAADVAVLEQIIAKVNGDIITSSEIDRSRKQLRDDLQQRGVKGPQLETALKEREKDFFRDRIDQLLLVQKGKELNVNVDAQLSKYIADLMRQLKIADQEVLARNIREQTGMTYEDWKNEAKNSMLTQRVVGQEVQSKINIRDEDKRKYYEEHKNEFVREERVFLREIFLKTDGKNDAIVEKKAKDLVARAKKGERFGDLARDNSDSDTAQQYGELGGFKKEEMDPALFDQLYQGGRNYVTDPLKRPNGFVIFKVEEIHKPGQAPFEEVENEVMERLFMPKMQPAVREYLTKLRQEAFLEIRDGYLDSGAAPGKDTTWSDPAQLKPETISKEELGNQKRRKRLLFIPIPGTSTSVMKQDKDGQPAEEKGESKSKALKAK
ncbi:MAG: peptidyl-prolyl cis-trans isomerase [Bryobacteraceae bacterium]|nr:peptidyl-prolyl cis-trans isomerase [Bryobacteraceae bacterium]